MSSPTDQPLASSSSTGQQQQTPPSPASDYGSVTSHVSELTVGPDGLAADSRVRRSAGPSSVVSDTPSVDSFTQMMADMDLITKSGRFNTTLAVKPQTPGSAGRKVRLLTNMFSIRVKDELAFHYDIIFKLQKANRMSSSGDTPVFSEDIKIGRIVKCLFEQLLLQDENLIGRKAFFDGRQNFYVLKDALVLEHKVIDFTADVEGEDRVVRISYKATGHQPLISQNMTRDAMQVMEIGIGYEAGKAMIQRGNKCFERSVRPIDLNGLNLELRMGFVKSLRATESGLCLNLDRAAALFQKGGVLTDVMFNVLNTRPGQYDASHFRLTPDLKLKVERELTNLRFEFRNPGLGYRRKYRLDRDALTPESVTELMFQWTDRDEAGNPIGETRTVSVFDFFRLKYEITLKSKSMPSIAVGKDKKNFLPLELCYLLPEQYYEKKMMEKTQAQVTKHTIQEPQVRYSQILNSVQQLKKHAEQVIDCQLDVNPAKVQGRVLDPPDMRFKSANEQRIPVSLNPVRGNPCDFANGTLNLCEPLVKWSIVQLQENAAHTRPQIHPQLIDFANQLVSRGQRIGWEISQNFGQFRHNVTSFAGLKNFMTAGKEKGQQQLLLMVIPSDMVYNDIKKIGNEIGLVTQCLRVNVDSDQDMRQAGGKISKIGSPTFVHNMLLKMNAKMGGTNAKLAVESMPAFLKRKVMVVGMDVFHPGDSSPIKHSIAGIVASFTPCFTRYMHLAKAQPQRTVDATFRRKEEIGDDIVFHAMTEFFNEFKKRNKFFPENILIFRDGVSEGQFDKVRLIELDQVYRAMQGLGFQAMVSFITVQKRHNVRLFQVMGQNNGEFVVGNPEPGTVVDTKVVHNERFECYLNSHHALKGTSKPCHYCVVHNECGLDADTMQQIAYYLCYLCARCYKPISIPIPVKYAHLVSELASKNLASAIKHNLPGSVNDWIRVHEDFFDKLNYA